jgi:hypothetical protein
MQPISTASLKSFASSASLTHESLSCFLSPSPSQYSFSRRWMHEQPWTRPSRCTHACDPVARPRRCPFHQRPNRLDVFGVNRQAAWLLSCIMSTYHQAKPHHTPILDQIFFSPYVFCQQLIIVSLCWRHTHDEVHVWL